MKKILGKLCAISAAVSMPLVASANLVVDGSFLPPPDGSPGFTTVGVSGTIGGSGAWTVTAGSVDVIGNPGYWQAPPLGGQSVDMSGNGNGTIEESISGLTIGTEYQLSFYMSGNPDGDPTTKVLDVSLGGDNLGPFTYNRTAEGNSKTDMKYVLETVDFTYTGGGSLLTLGAGQNPSTAYGAVIGDVSLVAVPEPSTVVAGGLLLLPFGASTLRIMRKKIGA
jgi:hypothetical protein